MFGLIQWLRCFLAISDTIQTDVIDTIHLYKLHHPDHAVVDGLKYHCGSSYVKSTFSPLSHMHIIKRKIKKSKTLSSVHLGNISKISSQDCIHAYPSNLHGKTKVMHFLAIQVSFSLLLLLFSFNVIFTSTSLKREKKGGLYIN